MINRSRGLAVPHLSLVLAFVALSALGGEADGESEAVTVSGELKKWHAVTITFSGPEAGETATRDRSASAPENSRLVNRRATVTKTGLHWSRLASIEFRHSRGAET